MTFEQLNPSLQKLIKDTFPEATPEQINQVLAMAAQQGLTTVDQIVELVSAMAHMKQQHGNKSAALQKMMGPRK